MASHESAADTQVVRPRRHGWGDTVARRAMSEIADSLRQLGGFEVCAIEVLRSDEMLEFVAIATDDPATHDEHDGVGSPLSAMYPALDQGREVGVLTFIRAEDMTAEAFDRMSPYGVVPDLPPSDDPARWHAKDMLVAQVHDDRSRLRSLVYFDLPRDGLRPTSEELTVFERVIRPVLHTVLVQIEREEFAQRIRLANGARAVIRSAAPQGDVRELFRIVRKQCREPFRAQALWINTIDEFDTLDVVALRPPAPEIGPQVRAALKASLVEAWGRQAVLIVERDHVWGDDELDRRYRAELTAPVAARGLREIVLVPIGAGPDILGLLAVDRGEDAPRWTDDESSAALDVAHDLGRAILNARAHERELAATAELRRLDHHRRTLIDTVARQLQNPLALVSGHLELLQDMDLPEDARRSVVPMIRNTARLTSLAQDLALLSRLADVSSPVTLATLDLAELTTEAISQVTPQAEHRDVTIALSVGGECTVQGHPLELSRCIGGLLDNAVKYSRRGGRVEVDVLGDGKVVRLTVRDHGIGISSSDQALLFGEFFRSSDPAALDRSGHGLGLSIVHQVVVRHSGTVEVESARGTGATFVVVLPRADQPALLTTW